MHEALGPVALVTFLLCVSVALRFDSLHTLHDQIGFVLTFAAGAAFSVLIRAIVEIIFQESASLDGKPDGENKIYNLKHGLLNIDTSEMSMWMNMGYWKDQETPRDLPRACRSLLQEILLSAKLIPGYAEKEPESTTSSTLNHPHFNLVDVGFGCGDQTIEVSKLRSLRTYIGLTLDSKQFAYAHQRLKKLKLLSDSPVEVTDDKNKVFNRQIFHADAAKPENWGTGLTTAINNICQSKDANWLLALDVLYHFSPSRLPLFRYVHDDLNASIMAYDLLLPNEDEQRLTVIQSMWLRLISLVTSTPYSNFLTPAQYRAELVAAGYADGDIEIRDVSVDVFEPLVAFMEWQDRQLKAFGFGIGLFHAAGWIFGWWARSRVVRGCIIIARRNSKPT